MEPVTTTIAASWLGGAKTLIGLGGVLVGLLWKVFTLHQSSKDSAASVIKLTALVETVTKDSRETSIELRMLSQNIGVQIEAMQKTLFSINNRLDLMMTKDEVAILTKHYDEVAGHSVNDRHTIHQRIDAVEKDKLSKEDHTTMCLSYRKTR